MRSLIKSLLIVLLVVPFPGNSSEAASTKEEIGALRQEMQQMQEQYQEQMQQLQNQINSLEERREESNRKVYETLKKVDDPDKWYNKFEAGYDKGLFFKSRDGNYKMKFRIRGQFQVEINGTDNKLTKTELDVRRMRLKWEGHAFKPWFNYVLELDADSGSVNLRDLYFTASYVDEFAPRVGQFKVPFNRERLTSSSALQLVERSIVNKEFAWGRDLGSAVYGALGNFVTYGGGVFNGDGTTQNFPDSNLLYISRVQAGFGGNLKLKPNSEFPSGGDYVLTPNFGKDYPLLTIGAGIGVFPGLDTDQKTPANNIDVRFTEIFTGFAGAPQADVVPIEADINFKWKFVSVEAEWDGRWIDPDASVPTIGNSSVFDWGLRVQGGIFIIPKTVEIAGRWAQIWYDDNLSVNGSKTGFRDTSWEVTPGINYYITKDNRLKIQFDYTFLRQETFGEPDVDSNIFRAQLQAYF